MSDSGGGSVDGSGKVVLTVERAKSGRASCRGCREKIAKGETRWLRSYPEGMGQNQGYYHLNCLKLSKKSRAYLTEEDIRFDGIFDEEEASEVKAAFKAVVEAAEAKKLKKEKKKLKKEKKARKKKKRSDSDAAEEESPDRKRKRVKKSGVEVTLKERPVKGKEAELFSKYSVMTIAELKRHLRANAQMLTGKKAELVDRCVDGELRGALPKCPKCVQGRLHRNAETGSISCHGYFDEDIKLPMSCGFVAEKVERLPWKDPEDEDAAPQTPVAKKAGTAKVPKEDIKEVRKIFSEELDGKAAANKMVEFARKKGLGLPTDDSEARQQVGGLFMEHKDENDAIDYVATYTALFDKYAAKKQAEAKPKPVAKVEANSELANLFEEMAGYFAKAGGTGIFKARAMKKAAINMRALDYAITSGKEVSTGKKKVAGIGKGSGKLIDEYLETGKIVELEEMRSNAAAAGD